MGAANWEPTGPCAKKKRMNGPEKEKACSPAPALSFCFPSYVVQPCMPSIYLELDGHIHAVSNKTYKEELVPLAECLHKGNGVRAVRAAR